MRIDTAKILFDAVLSLSNPSSPFPLPNQHLPTEILCLIFDHVAQEPNMHHRRTTLRSLIQTSTDWRKIALPTWNSQVILCSEVDASMWCESNHYKTLESSSLDLLHIDVSTAGSAEIEALLNSPMGDSLEERGIKIKHITLDMEVEAEEMSSTEDQDWYCFAYLFVFNNAVDWTLRMPAYSPRQYREAMLMFGEIPWDYEGRQELYLGSSPVFLTTRTVRNRLQAVNELLGFEDFLPLFTSYSVLSTPFLPFTVPLFLLDIFPTKPNLRPSRLEHLELSLEFNPSDPTEALRQIDAFFATISPRIERLSLRLRLTCPHPSPLDSSTFTDHFFAGIKSCLRRTHFEIGGFGLADNLLLRLATLPLTTLILHPIYPRYSRMEVMEQLLGFEPTTLACKLKILELEDVDENKHEENRDVVKLEEMCAERGIEVSHQFYFPGVDTRDREAQILAILMKEAGVEWD